jgi:SAM-dependent methyltransferase
VVYVEPNGALCESAPRGSGIQRVISSGMFANAVAYEQFMGRWSRLLAPQFLEFAGIPDGWHVLDVGSGTGSLAVEIAAQRPHCQMVGVEPCEDYVAYAKTRDPNGTVQFKVGNAQQLPFADAEFDASLSLLVFNFIPHPRKALAELQRVTRPGGRICAAIWDYGDRMQMLRAFWDTATELDVNAALDDEKNMDLCRYGELSALWREGGLANVDEQPLEITMQFGSFDDFWQPFLAGQGPAGAYVGRLAPERKIALRDQIKRLLPEAAQQCAFELRSCAWAVRGSKPRA